jgi:predicted nuclease of predicted toxin-antitoxin system
VAKNSKQHNLPPTIFIDRCLGPKPIVAAIRNAGFTAVHHNEMFHESTTDIEWLNEVGKLGWAVLTHDKRITKNVAELQAIIAANVHAFFVNISNPNRTRLTAAIVAALPQIAEIISRRDPPTISSIDGSGKISNLQGYDQLYNRLTDLRKRQHLE